MTFPGADRAEARSFRFRLPPGAAQGPDVWYLLKLHVTVTFAQESPPGMVILGGYTNGRAAAQIRFHLRRRSNGSPYIVWDTADLFKGASDGRSRGSSATVEFRNYLQLSGPQPGLNRLTLDYERFGPAKLAAIELGPRSGVYATRAGIEQLELEGGFAGDELEIGEPGEAVVRLSSGTVRPLRDVSVTVLPKSRHLFAGGPVTREIPVLRGEAEVRFAVGRTRPGELRVAVAAATASGSEAETVLSAEVGDGSGAEWGPWLIGAGALAAALGGLALRRRRRKVQAA